MSTTLQILAIIDDEVNDVEAQINKHAHRTFTTSHQKDTIVLNGALKCSTYLCTYRKRFLP